MPNATPLVLNLIFVKVTAYAAAAEAEEANCRFPFKRKKHFKRCKTSLTTISNNIFFKKHFLGRREHILAITKTKIEKLKPTFSLTREIHSQQRIPKN